jgi:hypothetical protein
MILRTRLLMVIEILFESVCPNRSRKVLAGATSQFGLRTEQPRAIRSPQSLLRLGSLPRSKSVSSLRNEQVVDRPGLHVVKTGPRAAPGGDPTSITFVSEFPNYFQSINLVFWILGASIGIVGSFSGLHFESLNNQELFIAMFSSFASLFILYVSAAKVVRRDIKAAGISLKILVVFSFVGLTCGLVAAALIQLISRATLI